MKIISISSGKGGVGKTTLACHLALALSAHNKRVLIVDGDLGLANVDIHFGVRPRNHLGDILEGKSVKECITPVLKNIDLMAGASGISELTALNSFQRRELIKQVQDLQFSYDYAIIDTASGIHEHVLHLNAVADDCVVVLSQDPTSFADAYALIKVLHQKYKMQNFKVVCNQIRNQSGEQLFIKFSEVVEKFLPVGLSFLGSIPYDEMVQIIQQQQRLIMRQSLNTQAGEVIKSIAIDLITDSQSDAYAEHVGQKTSGFEAIFRPATGHA